MKYHVMPLKTGLHEIREQLEKEGKEGWELVSIVHQPLSDYKSPNFSGYLAYFKKP
jgi:hypothetical protein